MALLLWIIKTNAIQPQTCPNSYLQFDFFRSRGMFSEANEHIPFKLRPQQNAIVFCAFHSHADLALCLTHQRETDHRCTFLRHPVGNSPTGCVRGFPKEDIVAFDPNHAAIKYVFD